MNPETSLQNLDKVLGEKAKQINPSQINWGYCVPGCGSCCPGYLILPTKDAEEIAKSFELTIDDLFTHNLKSDFIDKKEMCAIKSRGEQCSLLYSFSLCSIYDKKERPDVCQSWVCEKNKTIKRIADAGYDITSRLKKEWLTALDENYCSSEWYVLSSRYVKFVDYLLFKERYNFEQIERETITFFKKRKLPQN